MNYCATVFGLLASLMLTVGCASMGGQVVVALAPARAEADPAARDAAVAFAQRRGLVVAAQGGSFFWAMPEVPRRRAAFGESFDVGPLHFAILGAEAPIKVGTKEYDALSEDLSQAPGPWKVVVLRKPIFAPGPAPVDREQLDLADLLGRHKVPMTLCGGPGGYFRSMPIGSREWEATAHVILGPGAASLDEATPPWTARIFSEKAFCVLRADGRRLRLSVHNVNGRMLDLVEWERGARTVRRFFTANEILSGAPDPEREGPGRPGGG